MDDDVEYVYYQIHIGSTNQYFAFSCTYVVRALNFGHNVILECRKEKTIRRSFPL